MKGKYSSAFRPVGLLIILLLALVACAEDQQPAPEAAEAPAAEVAATEAPPTEEPTAVEPEPTAVPEPTPISFDNLHVPSPDWSEQIIYFVMTDRFNDGDPGNNDQGAGEYDPADFSKFNGGDLQGIVEQLDYIEGLGATALWITPPVSNQWWDPLVEFGGYHGYWAENFVEVDPHFGSLTDYQALSNALHGRDMVLIQDIVANHTGNFFTYQDEEGVTRYDANDPAANVSFNPDTVPVTKPSQPPFDQNDVTDPAQLEEGIYHWTPTINDFADETQKLTYQLSELDDLNTSNPLVQETLKNSFGYWIETVGVDGFRIDTILYVDHDFWNDFVHSQDAAAPGVNSAAAATGREEFLTFGEAFVDALPLDDAGDRQQASYLGSADKPELSAVLNFPLHWSINRVFAEGQPTNYMSYRLNVAQDSNIYPDPFIMPNFIDNHDVSRFLSKGSVDGLKQANMLLMTIPGIPVIYQGTEQGFTETRAAMFAEGWESGGVDHFDTGSEMYQFIAQLAQIRKTNPVFTKGSLTTIADNEAGPGILAYRRDYEGQTALVIYNTADRQILVTDLDTGLPAGTLLSRLAGIHGQDDLIAGREGKITMELPAREGMILQASDEIVELDAASTAEIGLEAFPEEFIFTEDIPVYGFVSQPGTPIKVIVNGNLGNAIDTTADEGGRFSAIIPISLFPPGQTTNFVTAYAPDMQSASQLQPFTAEVTETDARITVYDLAADDVGPLHTYTYPQDQSFRHQMDIISTTAAAFGSNLLVEIEMAETTTSWNPRNGFDHVMFHVFIDLPDQDGLIELPRLNANAPEGFAWNLQSFSEGWGNRLYSTEDASAAAWGQPVTPAQLVDVSQSTNTVSFLFLSDALGNPASLEGAKVYITTWDWNGVDSAYRPLKPAGGTWAFGGGDELLGDPRIIDDTFVLEIPAQRTFLTIDAQEDDYGPYNPLTALGSYTKPGDASFGQQMDLHSVKVTPQDEGFLVSLQMGELSNNSEAPNGFDRATFHLFLDTAPDAGQTVLPLLNAEAPQGLAWDFLAVVDGWNNSMYAAGGAAADTYGPILRDAPTITINEENSSIDLLFPPGALGDLESFEGVKLYVTTWDWDDEAATLRALTADGGDFLFGGGDSSVDPLILDEAIVGMAAPYHSPIPPAPQVAVTWTVTVPDSTPPEDNLYGMGPFNNWEPKDKEYQFSNNGDGTHTLVLHLDEGTVAEYRITRGTHLALEKLDEADRFANRTLEVPTGEPELAIDITIEGWWDK